MWVKLVMDQCPSLQVKHVDQAAGGEHLGGGALLLGSCHVCGQLAVSTLLAAAPVRVGEQTLRPPCAVLRQQTEHVICGTGSRTVHTTAQV